MKVKKEVKKEEQNISETKKTKKNAEINDKNTTDMPIGIKIAIGALVVICLGLIGWIAYQGGQNSMTDSNKDDSNVDAEVFNNNMPTENNLSDSAVEGISSTDTSSETAVAGGVTEDNTGVELSRDDMDKLSADIDKLSDADHEFQEVQDIFDEGL